MLNLPVSYVSEHLILEQRNHNHDKDLWQAIRQNKDFIGKYLPWPHKMNQLADIITATDKFICHWNNKEKFAYCIIDKKTHDLLGMIDLQKINYETKSAEIGYWLRRDKTGHGYIANALKVIETLAFTQGIRELRIRCDTRNTASIAVAKKAGYIFEKNITDIMPNDKEGHNREIYLKSQA